MRRRVAVVRNLYFVQDLEEDRKVEVFGHEWTSCPASLFEPDPSLDQSYAMRKGNKADYLAAIKTALGSSWGEVDKLPRPSDKPVVMVVDAMAFIQRYQHLGKQHLPWTARKYLRQLLGILPDKCDCIHFVGDRYDVSPAESLKGEEREKRMKTCPSKMKEYKPHDTLPIPEWKGFIHNPLKKANLLNYMGEAWAAQNKSLPAGCTLILGGIFCDPGRTVLLSVDCQVELPELSWWETWGGRYQNGCSHCILCTNSTTTNGCSGSNWHQMWSWCACTTSHTWMGCRSCGWRRWISFYLFIGHQQKFSWRGSMMLQLQILHPFSSAPTYLPDVTQWAICTEEEKGGPTQLLLNTWQTFCRCAGTVTLRKAWMFRKRL